MRCIFFRNTCSWMIEPWCIGTYSNPKWWAFNPWVHLNSTDWETPTSFGSSGCGQACISRCVVYSLIYRRSAQASQMMSKRYSVEIIIDRRDCWLNNHDLQIHGFCTMTNHASAIETIIITSHQWLSRKCHCRSHPYHVQPAYPLVLSLCSGWLIGIVAKSKHHHEHLWVD